MLNTKPIKNNNDMFENHIPNLSSDTKNTNNSDKIIQFENSKQKQLENIVNQANIDNNIVDINNIQVNELNTKQTGGVINDAHNNVYIQNPVLNREFTYDRYKDTNLNVSNLINGGKMFIGNSEKNNNNNINELKSIITNNQDNLIKINHFGELVEIKWNDIDNSFIINNINSNDIECKIYNESILKYIVSNETLDIGIKKYLFIISWNSQMEIFEFNFIDSIFTSNFDMMIKVQNFIYDTLINFDNLDVSDTYNYKESIIMFYFQMIIYLFNNYEKYLINNEQNKISRVYSSIVYRFSSLILKNMFKIKNTIDENNNFLNEMMILRSDIFSQINFMNNKLDQYNLYNQNNKLNTSESETCVNSDSDSDSQNSKDSVNSKKSLSSKQYDIVNIHSLKKITNSETNSETNINNTGYKSEKNIINMGYLNKNGKKINKIKELFTDELQINTENSYSNNSDKYDSDENGYFEINDTFIDLKKNNNSHDQKNIKHNVKNLIKLAEPSNIKKIVPLENSIISNIKSYTINSKERSFNPNSAIKNSKIFKIPL